ncbi:hypothetical protein GH714_005295 [Hevea brasiliensis]|uniref:Uncharacterized protein n=1 Tax=Hevea brasiliensis TaxID=3981 RepID=A0A6A6MBF3_HEVBR|nr:hypothetical protein GH714_005295 [Hevea brasiliensis]
MLESYSEIQSLQYLDSTDFDDEDEGEKEKKRCKESETLSQSLSVKSFLSSIPAPKNSSTLGVLPSAAGSGRRSIIENKVPTSSSASFGTENDQIAENYESYGAAAAVPERTGPSESALSVPGKRGRNDIPTEIIEVKQDELTKNRPREDQVKLTGIAFGPSYQTYFM